MYSLLKNYKQSFSILSKDKILFFGSGKVAYPSALKLIENYTNLHFVTHFTPTNTRLHNEVEILCKQKNLPYSTPIKTKNDKNQIKQEWKKFVEEQNQPDFGIVCSFGYMIPKIVINSFKKGMIVIHPSLLPKYRGGSPIFHAIANGQHESGVSYIQISPGKFDSGNLLMQKKIQLSQTAKYEQVEAQLANFCAQNIMQLLNNIDNLRPGKPQSELQLDESQKHKQHAPIIKDKHLKFNQPAQKIYNLYRAMSIPRVKFGQKEIILSFQKKFLEDTENKQVGSLKVKGKKLYVKCLDKFIMVQNWREPSKKQAPPGLFIAAYLRDKQQILWFKFQ